MTKKSVMIFLFMFLCIGLSADEFFDIDKYTVIMNVKENNEYEILEVIDLDFKQPRHGIYRSIPYVNGDKNTISDISVDGWEYKVIYDNEMVKILIGSADSYVEGEQLIELKYNYDVGLDDEKYYDELHHSIIGDEWNTIISNVEFIIKMPFDFDKSNIWISNGKYGENKKDVDWRIEENYIYGKMTNALMPYEAITILVKLNEGYWEPDYDDYEEISWDKLKLLKSKYIGKRVRVSGDYYGISDDGLVIALQENLNHKFNEDLVNLILNLRKNKKYEFWGKVEIDDYGKPLLLIENIVF